MFIKDPRDTKEYRITKREMVKEKLGYVAGAISSEILGTYSLFNYENLAGLGEVARNAASWGMIVMGMAMMGAAILKDYQIGKFEDGK